jgi:hypothetical protein
MFVVRLVYVMDVVVCAAVGAWHRLRVVSRRRAVGIRRVVISAAYNYVGWGRNIFCTCSFATVVFWVNWVLQVGMVVGVRYGMCCGPDADGRGCWYLVFVIVSFVTKGFSCFLTIER